MRIRDWSSDVCASVLVESVFGKAGRADTATDPAPLEMFETTIRFKPKEQWRPGMTEEKLVEELDARVRVPGLANFWIPPIRNRIDMLATGIKSPVRSEEHTSELQSLMRISYAVFCLKKNKKITQKETKQQHTKQKNR